MGEIQTTQTTTTTSKKWWSGAINVQTVVLIGGGIFSICAFVLKVNADNAEIQKLKAVILQKADAEALRDLEEKVNRQYQVARDDREKENKMIEQALDWIEYKKGYEQGLKEAKK